MKRKIYFIALLLFSFAVTLNAQFIIKKWTGRGIKPITQFSVASFNNKWGIIDDSNKVVLPFIYDSINYEYVFKFKLYKNGKVGLAHQFGITEDTVNSRYIQMLTVIKPNYDSIKIKSSFVIGYLDSLMSIYYFDGSLLFPQAKKSKVCFINPDYRYNFPNKKRERMEKLHKKNPIYADYLEVLIFYKNSFYRPSPATYPSFSKPTYVSKVRLTHYFKKRIKKQKLLECNN